MHIQDGIAMLVNFSITRRQIDVNLARSAEMFGAEIVVNLELIDQDTYVGWWKMFT